MKNIINKFLSAGDKYMPKMPLRQPGFMYTACGPVLVWTKKKHKGREELKKGEIEDIFIKMIKRKHVLKLVAFRWF